MSNEVRAMLDKQIHWVIELLKEAQRGGCETSAGVGLMKSAANRIASAIADAKGDHTCTECGDSFPVVDLAEFEYDYAEDTGFCGIAVCNDCHHDWRIERANARAIDRDIDVRLGK